MELAVKSLRFFAVVVFIIGTASSEVASSVGENFQLQPNRQPQAAVVVGGSGFYPGEEPITSQSAVAFTATRATTFSSSSSNVLFGSTTTDAGYGWDRQRGVFMCQSPGLYLFSWSAVSPSNRNLRLSIFWNDREVGSIWCDGTGYHSASNSIVLNLRQADVVYLRVTEGSIYEPTTSSRGYTTFTGFKLN